MNLKQQLKYIFPLFLHCVTSAQTALVVSTNFSSFSQTELIGANSGFGGIDLSYHSSYKKKFSYNIGADLYFNQAESVVNYWGVRIGGRYYFKGDFFSSMIETKEININSSSKHNFFISSNLKSLQYFISNKQKEKANISNTSNIDSSGSVLQFNFGGGYTYKLNPSNSIEIEAYYSILSLALTDEKVAPKSLIMSFGFSF